MQPRQPGSSPGQQAFAIQPRAHLAGVSVVAGMALVISSLPMKPPVLQKSTFFSPNGVRDFICQHTYIRHSTLLMPVSSTMT